MNEDNEEIISNIHELSDTYNITVQIYNHLQSEYDKKGSEIIEKLLYDLDNL